MMNLLTSLILLINTQSPIPKDAGIIVDNNNTFWYVVPAPYYDYLVLYSDTTENAQSKIVDVFDLDVHRRIISGKRDLSFQIDDELFEGYIWEFTLEPHEYHTIFPQQ